MNDTIWRVLRVGATIGAASTILALGLQSRSLRQQNRDLVTRFSKPHPGLIVPAFTARTLSGVSVAVGDGGGDDRQILFFFSTTCEYCRLSLSALMRVDSALRAGAAPHATLLAVALDSSSGLRRLIDSARFSAPVILLPSHRLALLYRVLTVPQLMIVDGLGRTIFAREGELTGPGAVDSVITAASRRPAATPGKNSVTARTLNAR